MTTDVVAILDANLSQVLETARPVKATVKEEAKTMTHPLETGASTTDHRIIMPTEIELSMLLTGAEYSRTYEEARAIFYRGELLTVQTRTGSYPSMCIATMPHEESCDMADGTTLALTLIEVQFVQAQFGAAVVRKKSDAKTVKRGEQQPQTSKRQTSILSGLFK